MEQEEKKKKLKCEFCRREIRLGEDLVTVEKGVKGPRGVVPLGNVLIFCSDDHVSKHSDNQETDSKNDIGFRIPY